MFAALILSLAFSGHVVVILDDINTEFVNFYAEGDPTTQPPTPTLDSLAAQGVAFRNFWTQPRCSPTRASFLTGLNPQNHGIGAVLGAQGYLNHNHVTLAELLPEVSIWVGKWHLGERWGPFDPIVHGFEAHVGTPRNLNIESYFNWSEKLTIGWASNTVTRTDYAATVTTDRALSALPFVEDGGLLVVAYHLAHQPWHVPPAHLHSQNPTTDFEMFLAMIEAVDTELGRLMAGIDLTTTTVWIFGDNGTTFDFSSRGKGTVYEEGLNCPLLVVGADVPTSSHGKWSEALVNVTDISATILDIEAIANPSSDSVSFLPSLLDPTSQVRSWVYSEAVGLKPNGEVVDLRAAREEKYKLIRNAVDDITEFYNVKEDPTELFPLDIDNLTDEEQGAFDALWALLQ